MKISNKCAWSIRWFKVLIVRIIPVGQNRIAGNQGGIEKGRPCRLRELGFSPWDLLTNVFQCERQNIRRVQNSSLKSQVSYFSNWEIQPINYERKKVYSLEGIQQVDKFVSLEKNLPLLKIEQKLKSNNGQEKIFAPVATDKGF